MNERRAAETSAARPAKQAPTPKVPPPSRPHDPRRLLVSPDLVTRGLVGCPGPDRAAPVLAAHKGAELELAVRTAAQVGG